VGVFEPSGFLRDAAVAAAQELGLPGALAAGARTVDELAAALGVAGGHRLRALLEALAALGALARHGDRFEACAPGPLAAAGRGSGAAADVAAATGDGGGTASMTVGAVQGDGGLARGAANGTDNRIGVSRPEIPRAGWGLLAEVIRLDRPLSNEPADERRYHAHLLEAGAPAARELAPILGDGGGGEGGLLDLGGGAGAYTAAFLDAHPAARATLVDAPATVALAESSLARFGGRVRFVAGDARTAAVGEGHGAVLLANVLHLHPQEVCAELCAAAARAAAPGGVVAVVDLRIDEDRGGPIEGVMFALNMVVYTEGGGVYEVSRIRGWLAAAGLVDIEARPLAAAPEAMVVIGRRPRDRAADERARAAVVRESDDSVRDPDSVLATERAVVREPGAVLATEDAVVREPGAVLATEDAVARELDAALAAAGAAAWRELDQSDGLLDEARGAGPPRLAFAAPLARTLARAIAHERAEGTPAATERAAALARHYADVMPRARVALLAGRAAPAATLFHTRLDWARLPRLEAALDRLYAVLADSDADATAALGAPSAAAFRARTPTLAALYERTCYGGSMPLLYGSEADLAYFHAHASAGGLGVHGAIDRYLTAPLVHELCHLAPAAESLPLHLDECVAGWLGAHVHPELAYPAPGHDDAIFAAPWLSQVGQAIARAFGVRALVRSHAGAAMRGGTAAAATGVPPAAVAATPSAAALPLAFTEAAARLGWDDWRARRTLHFLSDTLDPDPWVGLALAVGAGLPLARATLVELARLPPSAFAALPDDPAFDLAIVADGLRAMCLEDTRIEGSFRTRTRLPDAPITIDAAAGRIAVARPSPLLGVAPRYWLPPTVSVRITGAGRAGYELRLGALDAIPEAAAAICAASPASERAGFALRPI
jgi:hypothetical protein